MSATDATAMTFDQAVGRALRGAKVRHPDMPEGHWVASWRGIIMIFTGGNRRHHHMPLDWIKRTDWHELQEGDA